MMGIRSIPRRQRYAPYLAGMTWDLALMLVCLLLQLAGLGWRLPGAIVYLLALSVLFQFRFFMRTDLYFVLTNWLRLGNLMADTRQWLVTLVRRMLHRPAPTAEIATPSREWPLIRLYAGFAAVGVVITVGQFLLLGLPLLLHFLAQAYVGLGAGPGQLAFWDSGAFLLVTLAEFAILGVIVWRERRETLFRLARQLLHRAAIG
jgi:putative peptide zinc metalloprotease protein